MQNCKVEIRYRPPFYIDNLTNKYGVLEKAISNLYDRGYTDEELKKIDNYDELGIVEFVATGDYFIKNNHIYAIRGWGHDGYTFEDGEDDYERLKEDMEEE